VLRDLEYGLKSRGFNEDVDRELLKRVYGTIDQTGLTLFDGYEAWSSTAHASEEKRREKSYASPEECLNNVLDEVRTQIERLVTLDNTQRLVHPAKVALDKLRAGIPDSPDLDRFLRYEASIERAIDRTLSQLERRQRIRQGQAIVADLNVKVSG
jgi:hypothetical protein